MNPWTGHRNLGLKGRENTLASLDRNGWGVPSSVMDTQRQVQSAQRFRAMHDRSRVLLLPNAWDAGSAAVLADLGFPAIATTSGGVAWSLGYPDGEQLSLEDLLAVVRRMTRVVTVPVTVDFEAGFGVDLGAVHESVRAVIEAGAVGINLEDGIAHERLRPVEEAVARIASARAAANASGVPIFINARVDTWITGYGTSEEDRIEESLRRARAYLAAGADGIYPIALADPEIIAKLCSELDAPINIGARPGLPDLQALGALGVARVSTATRLVAAAYSSARDAAEHLRDTGRFDGLGASIAYDDFQQLFPHA